ncbi:MAG: hypothetical protein R3A45_04755 [Bdellovibrionota bacterium]
MQDLSDLDAQGYFYKDGMPFLNDTETWGKVGVHNISDKLLPKFREFMPMSQEHPAHLLVHEYGYACVKALQENARNLGGKQFFAATAIANFSQKIQPYVHDLAAFYRILKKMLHLENKWMFLEPRKNRSPF